ncbi:MAG: hypothetical protein Q4E13_01035 [Clostridia bacterium]|nr:hypothetical protein [Clostridia bacterium]
MGLIVCKFGGTSLAGVQQIEAVRRIVRDDPRRRLIVASAPGRRYAGDEKITDLLIRRAVEPARRRLQSLADAAGASVDVSLPASAPIDFLASRGEFYSARILAHALGFDFVDAAELIRFRSDGQVDFSATAAAIRRTLRAGQRAVIPGFYGALPDGLVHTLPRGGSDTTGALVAAALRAERYENFTDVPGLFDADPALIAEARPVMHAAYDEVRLLSRCGATVLHEDALRPAEQANVPIRLCSTFEPDAPGTLIHTRMAERLMVSARLFPCGTRCAVAGQGAMDLLPQLCAHFPNARVRLLPGGLTITLHMPCREAVAALRQLTK